MQDAQRRLPERVPNTAVVSVIDLELDDLIHVGTQGLKRAGQRLAQIALRELFGQVGATTPTFDRVTRGPNNTLLVEVQGRQHAASAGMGRHGRGMGMGGMGMARHGRRGMGRRRHGRWAAACMPAGMRHDAEPRRAERRGAQARAAHRRLLDPQGGRVADPLDLRGRVGKARTRWS